MFLSSERVIPDIAFLVTGYVSVAIVDRSVNPASSAVVLAGVSSVVVVGVVDLQVASVQTARPRINSCDL